MKNIVVCCDGTANEFATDRTNVVKLFYALEHSAQQVAFYHPGLGTMEPPGALTGFAKWLTRLLGKAIGYGLEADVGAAYAFLMNTFEPGDRLFFFGFSRGAYTVRVVCSLLHMYGLLPKGNESLVPYAIRMMTAEAQGRFRLAQQFKDTFSTACTPWFVGVWDTVSSVGWIENPLKVPFTANNPDIEYGRQAISIDERRAFFRQNLWRPPDNPTSPTGPKDVKQVWFPGVHCDVGGGYPEAQSGLSKVALEWMFAEANACELKLDKARMNMVLGKTGGNYVAPDPTADMHNSLTPPWWIAEFALKKHYDPKTNETRRRMNLFRHRTIPPDAQIHDAAYRRSEDYKKRLPSTATRVSTLPLP